MGVVAEPALTQNAGVMSVDFGKSRLLVAIETAALEVEASAASEFVTLRALDTRERRMLVKRLESGRRIGAYEKRNFFSAAFPHQRE